MVVLMREVFMSPQAKSSLFHLWSAGKFFLAYAARPRAGLEKETSLPKQSSLRARFMYWATGPRPCVGYTLPLRLA